MKTFKQFVLENIIFYPDTNVPLNLKINLKKLEFKDSNVDVIGSANLIELKNVLVAYVKTSNKLYPIGYIDYTIFDKKVFIDFIYVREDLRNQGIGKVLLDMLKSGKASGTSVKWKKDDIKFGFSTKLGNHLINKWKKLNK